MLWALNALPNIGATADSTVPIPLPPAVEAPAGFPDLADVAVRFLARGGEFLVVELDGHVVGMGGYRPGADGCAEVLRVRVHPAVRRRGIGRALMAGLERCAARDGLRSVHLDTATNQPEAMAFYRGLGYREVGRECRPGWTWTLVYYVKVLGAQRNQPSVRAVSGITREVRVECGRSGAGWPYRRRDRESGAGSGMEHQRWMQRAVGLARRSPRSASAFAVGAVLVDAAGREIASGYSRDTDPLVHAEESALLAAAGDARLPEATLYSTLEPCSKRAHRPDATCTALILAARIPRVVIAWHEPDVFVTCEGVALLIASGVEVLELPEFAAAARAVNAHLPGL